MTLCEELPGREFREASIPVLETKRLALRAPCLEDGDTRLAEFSPWQFLAKCHGSGSNCGSGSAAKCEEGEPASRLPLSEPNEPRRFD